MTRRHWIAIVVGLSTIVITLIPPLWVRTTGDEVTLDIEPVDPLSLFRGNYVDLRYDFELAGVSRSDGSVYGLFADERPARLIEITEDRPSVGANQFCIRGEVDGSRLVFPNLEQYFVTPERGGEIERDLNSLVAVVKVTSGCRAILVGLEPK